MVAGRNFGCGSSREHAPIALLNMGAKAVIADSFARIFFRNAVNLGLVPVICKGISQKVKEGQTLTLDFVKGVVTVQETGESYPCEALGEPGHEDPCRRRHQASDARPLCKRKSGTKSRVM